MKKIITGLELLAILIAALGRPAAARADGPEDFVRAMNLGKAYLENRNAAKAIEVLTEAVKLEPNSTPALRNLARAQLLAAQPAAALETLAGAAKVEPESTASSYLTGLTYIRLTRFADAIEPLEKAVRLDPQSATLRYQLALAYQSAGRHDKAREQFVETTRLDPLHGAAQYRLAGYARDAGDMEEYQRRQSEFMRLRKLTGGETRSGEVLEQCVYTQPEAAPTATAKAKTDLSPTIAVHFTDVTDEKFPTDSARAASAAAVIDMDAAGRYTVFLATADGGTSLLTIPSTGAAERKDIDAKLPEGLRIESCIAGDFHDDVPKGTKYDSQIHALTDVFMIGAGGAALLKRTGPTSFADVTESAGLKGLDGHAAQWVDYDHDGDLDLIVARDRGLELWQNNGDAKFENVTARVGIKETGSIKDVAASDLDADVSVDLIAARGTSPTVVYKNMRAGRFAPLPEPPGPWPPADRLLVDDLDNDGLPDAVLIGERIVRVASARGLGGPQIDLGDTNARAAALLDYDNDGRLDLLVVGSERDKPQQGVIRLWRNISAPGDAGVSWREATEEAGLSRYAGPGLKAVLAADFDADGDSDLLLIDADDRLRMLRNDGGQANAMLKLRLSTVKTNPSGIGTHVELRKGDFWVTRAVTQIPVEIGLGGRKTLDTLQTLWTNGVVDNQIDVAITAAPLAISEKNVATGSCPFLYAWDGSRFRFVTDILGNAPVGLSLRRDVVLPADPDEIVLVGESDALRPLDGAYQLQITSEFLEVLYLDEVRLIAVDHPPEIEIHPTDKIMLPPFPGSELWALGSPKSVTSALADDGVDRTDALRAIDGVFAPPGPLLPPPFRGMCHPMSLTLDFGPLNTDRPLVLALTGWLQYGQASTNIALSQSPATVVIPPSLEVETDNGEWKPVDVVVGMPCGKTKTILCDLSGKLPPKVKRLRLTTTFEIRWDRIALMERVELPPAWIHYLAPVAADLQWRGFSDIRSRAPGHPTTPDHELVSDLPPWRTVLEGWCTRYGDVLELTAKRDDRVAIINAGDAITVRFDGGALPTPTDRKRTFFFYSVGWEKDGDYNVVDSQTVGPLPVAESRSGSTANDERGDWDTRYNTRWVPKDRFKPIH